MQNKSKTNLNLFSIYLRYKFMLYLIKDDCGYYLEQKNNVV